MTFDEILLYEAVYDTYRTIDNPRSSAWLIDTEKKEDLARRIQRHLPIDYPCNLRRLLLAWDLFGKSSVINGAEQKKVELLVLVARTHGRKCFYAGRGQGECSSEVSIDRLVPGARGGEYTVENCVICCGYHNSQRGDRNIEEFLS